MYKIVKNIPHVCEIFQRVLKYINFFQSKALQNLPKLGFFGLKRNHLATLMCFGHRKHNATNHYYHSSFPQSTGVARFFLVQTYQKREKYTNDHILYRTAIMCRKIYQHFPFQGRPSKIYPNWDFWS
jgi:hypothetical protein